MEHTCARPAREQVVRRPYLTHVTHLTVHRLQSDTDTDTAGLSDGPGHSHATQAKEC